MNFETKNEQEEEKFNIKRQLVYNHNCRLGKAKKKTILIESTIKHIKHNFPKFFLLQWRQ